MRHADYDSAALTSCATMLFNDLALFANTIVTRLSLLEAKVATFRKRHNKWQAIVRHKSIGTTSKSFHNKSEAKKWAFETERSIEANTFGKLHPSSMSLGDCLERYQTLITPQKRGCDAENRRINRLLKDPISAVMLDNLTSRTLAQFRDRRLKDGNRAAQYDLVIIRHCIKIAINEWDLLLDKNPADAVKMPPNSKPRERRLSASEYRLILEAANHSLNPHIKPVIIFAIETAMRQSEILNIEWSYIDWQKRTILLPLTKNGTSREVPLSQIAYEILMAQKEQPLEAPFPLTGNAFRLAWNRVKKRAMITDLRFHDLRHEAISRLFELGLSLPEVALISGHKDPRMLFRYTHLRAEDIVAKLVIPRARKR